MIRKFGAKQLKEITVGNTTTLVSYKTPVVVLVGDALFVTDAKYSKTTTRHINYYISNHLKMITDINHVDQSVIYNLAAVTGWAL